MCEDILLHYGSEATSWCMHGVTLKQYRSEAIGWNGLVCFQSRSGISRPGVWPGVLERPESEKESLGGKGFFYRCRTWKREAESWSPLPVGCQMVHQREMLWERRWVVVLFPGQTIVWCPSTIFEPSGTGTESVLCCQADRRPLFFLGVTWKTALFSDLIGMLYLKQVLITITSL